MSESKSQTGHFVWYELMTTDPAAAIGFYKDVVGWTTQQWENSDYTMWVGEQGPIGGVMTLAEEAKKMGAPPHWMGNLQVADVDAAAELVKARGGQIFVPPQDMPKIGRFSVVADPQGASLSLFKPESGAMGMSDRDKAGEVGWHELMTSDHAAAWSFYKELVGWEQTGEFDMGPMGKYLLFGRDGKAFGGMMTRPKEMPVSAWSYYVRVTDLDAALERAKKGEARLLNGPMEVPGGERVAQLMDPQGAAFCLLSLPVATAK